MTISQSPTSLSNSKEESSLVQDGRLSLNVQPELAATHAQNDDPSNYAWYRCWRSVGTISDVDSNGANPRDKDKTSIPHASQPYML
jgi:hypothetical protein